MDTCPSREWRFIQAADGSPAAGAPSLARRTNTQVNLEGSTRTVVGRRRALRFHERPPGDYRVTARRRSRRSSGRDESVVSGQDVSGVALTLAPAHRLQAVSRSCRLDDSARRSHDRPSAVHRDDALASSIAGNPTPSSFTGPCGRGRFASPVFTRIATTFCNMAWYSKRRRRRLVADVDPHRRQGPRRYADRGARQ